MTRLLGTLLASLLLGLPLLAQEPQRDEDRLPDGRRRSEAILQADYERSLRDLEELIQVAQELKQELEKNKYHVLSVQSVRAAERLEQLARRIRARMRRF